jgi:hypothetical protein
VRDHSAVTAYMDCTWISTELLPHNALDTPTDADLVVGYLFQVTINIYHVIQRLYIYYYRYTFVPTGRFGAVTGKPRSRGRIATMFSR